MLYANITSLVIHIIIEYLIRKIKNGKINNHKPITFYTKHIQTIINY